FWKFFQNLKHHGSTYAAPRCYLFFCPSLRCYKASIAALPFGRFLVVCSAPQHYHVFWHFLASFDLAAKGVLKGPFGDPKGTSWGDIFWSFLAAFKEKEGERRACKENLTIPKRVLLLFLLFFQC
ncbi:hypothetical protein PanWU01x14_279380, partial [Parasponia andersonii]